jgi:protein-disulfide isomerase
MMNSAFFRIVRLVACLPLVPLASAQTSDKPQTPLAVVNGQSIYEADLTAVGAQLWQLRTQEYQIKSTALENVVNQKLLEAEASKKGVPADKFLEQEVDAKLGELSEAELEAFYLGQKERLGNRPLSELKDQLRQALKQSKIQQARQDYYKGLREKAQVSMLLQAPKVEVKADSGRLRGDAKAAVTIIEFSDFQCPYCQGAQATLKEVLAKYEGKVKLGFRDFPLQQIHAQAQPAAEASRCAGEQGKFWEYHDLLFANPSMLQQTGLIEQARKLQLDDKRFEACLTSGKFRSAVQSDQQDGMRAGVNGTPAFFVNGILLSGNQPASAFYKIIEEQLSVSPKQSAR